MSLASRAWPSAVCANDMHLGIRVPNTWYRAVHGAAGSTAGGFPARYRRDAAGHSYRSSVGSNGHVAWGFTNSYGDWTAPLELMIDPKDANRYRTPDGWRSFAVVSASGWRGEADDVLEVGGGQVVDKEQHRTPARAAWTAHYPEAVNLGLDELQTAPPLEAAMAIANRSAPQNFTVAGRDGAGARSSAGSPVAVGFDGRTPAWAGLGWDGWLSPQRDRSTSSMWTANARVMDSDGDQRSYDLGARRAVRKRSS